MMLFLSVSLVKAQRWGNHHHHYPQQNYGRPCGARVVVAPPRIGCGIGVRRPFINVVIAPRPRVVVAPQPVYTQPQPQPQVERIWIEGHYEETQNGRIWVEGHYIQREVY